MANAGKREPLRFCGRQRAVTMARFMPGLRGGLRNFGRRRSLAVLFLAVLLAVRAWDPWPVEILRLKAFDLYQQLKPRQTTDSPVAVIAIDEASLAALGQWPWPRTVLATLISRVVSDAAAAIGIAAVFPEEDRTSPRLIYRHLLSIDEDVKRKLATLPSNDEILARAIEKNRVVLGRAVASGARTSVPLSKLTPVAIVGPSPLPYVSNFDTVVSNVKALDAAASGQGVLTLAPEIDGVVRRVPAVVAVGSKILPSLSLEMLRVATGSSAFAVRVDRSGVAGIVIGQVPIPTDRSGRTWVRFSSKLGANVFSAKDVIDGQVPPGMFGGKLVLIGGRAPGIGDLSPTPLNVAMYGVDIQAQLLETILTQSYFDRPSFALGAELSLMLAAGLILIVIVPYLKGRWTVLVGAAVVASITAVSWWLFRNHLILLDVSFPVLTLVIVYSTLVYAGYVEEEQSKRSVRNAFNRYVSPQLVERLAENPDQLQLGGERRNMTVMFSDIRGFTAISERYAGDPQGLTSLINRFLTPMTDAVIEHQGTIDKYIGDCLMAFWNAPLQDDRHASHACAAALSMFEGLQGLNAELRKEVTDDAKTDSESSAYEMAKRYERGVGVERDAQKAFELLQQEAEHGFSNAQYSLGKAYRDGIGVDANPREAARWFLAAAELGYAKAQRHIGSRFARGDGMPRDDIEGLKWLTIAAANGLNAAETPRMEVRGRMPASAIAESERRARIWRPAVEGRRAIQLEMGVGINTGDCLVGNMGSNRRFDYSVLGDPVNLASRLEGVSKNYGANIVLSEYTQELAPEFATLELDLIAVKGKSAAVKIYGLLGDESMQRTEAFLELQTSHNGMLDAYRRQEWAEARHFAAASRQLEEALEYLYETYERRIDVFENDPPGEDWDGVFIAQTK